LYAVVDGVGDSTFFGCDYSNRFGFGCFVTAGPDGSGVKQLHVT